ncbi:serine/threonine-protein kinase [Parafrankia elaeagni]|uniref:serine/threonine-protein kinase n=1 Tax=Parafrankia elaeagni TaxID=222534 RepID=UPI00039EC59B|nr:serine/threonine-protein kinase [Parafrankia elaeagni]
MPAALVASDPAVVGRYRLRARLGSGGMGAVYLGVDPAGRPVAVKMIRPDLVAEADLRERFRREVAAARRIRGTFVAAFVDADAEAESPWLVTEYVEGLSLTAAVGRHGGLEEAQLVALGCGLATALLSMHSAGLVHRDLKPSNVLLGTTGPKIIDFGIARALDGTAHTGTGAVLGTVAWMAPEQLLGERAGPAADIYAWAMCLLFAARGRHPFPAEAPAAMAMRMLRDSPDLTGVPGHLVPVLTRALQKNPAHRPSADEALCALLGVEIASLAVAQDVTLGAMEQLWVPWAQPLLTSPASGIRPPAHRRDEPAAMDPTSVQAGTPAAGPGSGPGPGPGFAPGSASAPGSGSGSGERTLVEPGRPARRRRARLVATAAVAAAFAGGAFTAFAVSGGLGDRGEGRTAPRPQPAGTAAPDSSGRPTGAEDATPAGRPTLSGGPADGVRLAAPAKSPGASVVSSAGPGQTGAVPAVTTAPTTAPAPSPAAVPLVRYYNGADHTALTGPAPGGYWAESVLGSVYQSGDVPGTHPLYACWIGANSFTSGSPDCEGQQVAGVLGWVYASQPSAPATRAIVRCRTGSGDHFVSPDGACEGQIVEGLQGYVLTG